MPNGAHSEQYEYKKFHTKSKTYQYVTDALQKVGNRSLDGIFFA